MTSFTLGGRPSSIRASASVWAGFSTATSWAASDLKAVDTSEFQGSEADTYRARLNSDLVPHLTVASEAWDLVASALRTYATGLEGLQTRMAALAQQHAEQESKVRTARRTYEQDNTTGADTTATSFQDFQQADQQLGSLVTRIRHSPGASHAAAEVLRRHQVGEGETAGQAAEQVGQI